MAQKAWSWWWPSPLKKPSSLLTSVLLGLSQPAFPSRRVHQWRQCHCNTALLLWTWVLYFCWHRSAQYRHVHLETFNSFVIYRHALRFCLKAGTKKSKVGKFWAASSTTAKLGDDFPVCGGVHLMHQRMQSRRIQYLPNCHIIAKSPRVRKHDRKVDLHSCTIHLNEKTAS